MALTRSIVIVQDSNGNPAFLLSVKHPTDANPLHRVRAAVMQHLGETDQSSRLDWSDVIPDLDHYA